MPDSDALADFNPPAQLLPPSVWQENQLAFDAASLPPTDTHDFDEGEPTVIVGGYGRHSADEERNIVAQENDPSGLPFAQAPEFHSYRARPSMAQLYHPATAAQGAGNQPASYQDAPPARDSYAAHTGTVSQLEPPHPVDKPVTSDSRATKIMGFGVSEPAPSIRESVGKPENKLVSTTAAEAAETDDTTETKTRPKWRSWLIDILVVILGALVFTSLLRLFVYQAFNVPTGSMEQTLQENDSIVAIKLLDFQRGDIVVFEDTLAWLNPSTETVSSVRRALEFVGLLPSSTMQHLVKRVIGLPGDRVMCCDANGYLIVNGVSLNESEYLYSVSGVTVEPSAIAFDVTVPKDRIFVMGDHRNNSADSRSHLCWPSSEEGQPVGMDAFIPIKNVVGKVVAISSPWSRMKWFSTPEVFADVPAPGPPPDEPSIRTSQC
jgi:signal peptidase I